MAVSIKDIARVAGVAHSTVSRALRGSSLIPEPTASRIRKIAEEMGYSASAIGRGLVQGRTEAIGVVVTSIADPFNGEVVGGLEEYANQHGYSVILATSQAVPAREIAVVKGFQSRRVDGIIVASSRVGASYAKLLADTQIPVVLLNNQHPGEFNHSVRIDNTQGAFEATNHLLALGHRRIGYVGDQFGLNSDTERRAGFQQAMQAAGVRVEARYLLNGDGRMQGAMDAFGVLQDPLPTAFFCYNDLTAVGVMEAAKRRGLLIPDDLSVVGFDDIQVAALVTPGLTTIRQPKWELGTRAMSLILRILRGEEAERSAVLTGELVVRGSTGSVPNRKP